MNELHPDTRALLDAARDAHDPTLDDRARIREKLTARLGAAAFATTVVAATSSTPRAAARWGFGAAAVGIAALAIWALSRGSDPPAPRVPIASMVSAATAQAAPPFPVPATIDLDPAPVPVESLHVAAAPTAEKRTAPASTVEQTSTLEVELALLRGAKKALDDGDATRALSLLDEHQRRFPAGVLVEERAATRVLALCAAGRTAEARSSATDFLARYPRSPSAPRVRASCGASSP
jgi:hypothetical protein